MKDRRERGRGEREKKMGVIEPGFVYVCVKMEFCAKVTSC